ncbi:MAG: hypothetical protein JXA83_15085 [Acidimicrobiales bacterium]|nr:hypothetical protein [Acidimicrobiales bacterium]
MADNDLLKRLLDAGMTFTALTQSRAEELIRDLVRAGAVQAEHAQAALDELVERSRRNSEKLIDAVRTEIDDQLAKRDLATRDDIERMVQRFADTASAVLSQAAPGRRGARATTTAPSSAKASAKKSTAKKSTAKKSSAKKSSAKKSTAKRSSAKKSSAKKLPAKKAPAKKSTGKKSSAKKSSAKKSSAKKASTGTASSSTSSSTS